MVCFPARRVETLDRCYAEGCYEGKKSKFSVKMPENGEIFGKLSYYQFGLSNPPPPAGNDPLTLRLWVGGLKCPQWPNRYTSSRGTKNTKIGGGWGGELWTMAGFWRDCFPPLKAKTQMVLAPSPNNTSPSGRLVEQRRLIAVVHWGRKTQTERTLIENEEFSKCPEKYNNGPHLSCFR